MNPFLPIESECTSSSIEPGEKIRDFVCRSSREDIIELRELLHQIFEFFPMSDRKNALAQEILDAENQILPQLVEMLASRIFQLEGFTVIPEPTIVGVSSKPDFHVSKGCEEYLVEVKTTLTDTQSELHERRMVENLLHYSFQERIVSRDFWISVYMIRSGKVTPSAREFSAQVQSFINNLAYEAVLDSDRAENFDRFETVVRTNGWEFGVTANCKFEARGKQTYCLGSPPGRSRYGSETDRVRKMLSDKHRQHKNHTTPFIFVFNIAYWFDDIGDIAEALLGREAVRLRRESDGSVVGHGIRDESGFWGSPANPKHTDVHAVIGMKGRSDLSPEAFDVKLFHGPHCSSVIRESFQSIPAESFMLEECEAVKPCNLLESYPNFFEV